MLSGCTVDLLQPRGPIGDGNSFMMVLEWAVMMCVVVPVIIATLLIAWKYRASNKKAEYWPNWSFSHKIETFVWGIPIVIILILSVVSFWSTHFYDPYKPLTHDQLVKEHAENQKPLNIQVVSLDWKWLFIYPDLGIATINELDVPTKTELNFHITSDAVMTSFFIPQLGSQIYAMAGMQTELHLLAREPGIYKGMAAQYTGKGFSDMHFQTIAMPVDQFQSWVENVKNGDSKFASGEPLNGSTYAKYSAPQVNAPVTYFADAQSDLFQYIVAKYNNGAVKDRATGKIMHIQPASNSAASDDTGM
ncbi:ubiquinol oxidase subunit II [Aristophania vespae]|uniref:Ubiquinol oxidase subunit 2 n=2 Tax=Aristophania vespae TaxID=2697033 RepID=A0A6P1NFM3_9PROT|nr:ubiquinol oxidase subunit II [Aristophania vespae]